MSKASVRWLNRDDSILVQVTCECGHKFRKRIINVMTGIGCPECHKRYWINYSITIDFDVREQCEEPENEPA